MQYEISQEVAKVAKDLIGRFHSQLGPKEIVFVFQIRKDKSTGESQAQMRKGKPVLADVKVIGGLNAFLCSGEARTDENGPTPFACVVVSKHAWNLLKPKQREAMIDEQLCRLDYDAETGRPTILDYDANVFVQNMRRFGAWSEDLQTLMNAASEFPLFEEIEKQEIKVKKAAAGNGKAVDPPVEASAPAPDLPSLKSDVAKKRGRQQSGTSTVSGADLFSGHSPRRGEHDDQHQPRGTTSE